MELTVLTRLRIIAAMTVGIGLLGFLAWPLVKPAEPLGAITLYTGDINLQDAIVCILLAFFAGFLGQLISYPYGRQIGFLAVPSGLAAWSLRSGGMSCLLRMNNTLVKRQALYGFLKWEGFFWLVIVFVGWLGVLAGETIFRSKPDPVIGEENDSSKTNKGLSIVTALIAIIVITQFVIGIFAQDVKMFDAELGSVVGQPSTGQIAFAVFVSFGISAFVVKKFLNISYIFPVVSAALLTLFSIKAYARDEVLAYMVENWPVAFYSRAICAILPIQMVAFAVFGSVAGYWIAIKYAYWRKYGD